jgi:hypothetical protein
MVPEVAQLVARQKDTAELTPLPFTLLLLEFHETLGHHSNLQ